MWNDQAAPRSKFVAMTRLYDLNWSVWNKHRLNISLHWNLCAP